MEAAHYNIPIVALPFNSDQLVHFLRFKELRLATSPFTLSFRFLKDLFFLNWKSFDKISEGFKLKDILECIEKSLRSSNKNRYIKVSSPQESIKDAVKVIENSFI
jgi:hypothetical protein